MMMPQRAPMMTRGRSIRSACMMAIPQCRCRYWRRADSASSRCAARRGAGPSSGLLSGRRRRSSASHCTDDSPLFVATWYTIATALSPRSARWQMSSRFDFLSNSFKIERPGVAEFPRPRGALLHAVEAQQPACRSMTPSVVGVLQACRSVGSPPEILVAQIDIDRTVDPTAPRLLPGSSTPSGAVSIIMFSATPPSTLAMLQSTHWFSSNLPASANAAS